MELCSTAEFLQQTDGDSGAVITVVSVLDSSLLVLTGSENRLCKKVLLLLCMELHYRQ